MKTNPKSLFQIVQTDLNNEKIKTVILKINMKNNPLFFAMYTYLDPQMIYITIRYNVDVSETTYTITYKNNRRYILPNKDTVVDRTTADNSYLFKTEIKQFFKEKGIFFKELPGDIAPDEWLKLSLENKI